MKNYLSNPTFKNDKVSIELMLDTSTSKELRICLSQHQEMREHSAPVPIVIMVIKGKINFSVEGTTMEMIEGDIINLEAKVKHNLTGLENSIIRLTLSKQANLEHVKDLA